MEEVIESRVGNKYENDRWVAKSFLETYSNKIHEEKLRKKDEL